MTTDGNQPELVPGSPEYNAAMAAKMGGSENQPTPQVPSIPEGGDEKFYNKETGAYDWPAHAKELRFQLDQKSKGAEKPGEQKTAGATEEAAKSIIEAAGLTVETLRDQVFKNGDIDADARTKLVAGGIPSELIDDYIALAKSHVAQTTHEAIEYAGGQAGWDAMNDWCMKNLKPEEQASYNKMLGGDKFQWTTALDSIRARMGPGNPSLMRPGASGGRMTDGGAPFQSRKEMTAAMSDPRYNTDAAYRQSVMNRVRESNFEADNVRY